LEFVLGRGLLRLLLGKYLNLESADLCFAAGPHGKPELVAAPQNPAIRFNVSHSHGMLLHAFSLDRRVGVDVGRIRHEFSGLDVARRFFSARESAHLQSQAEAAQAPTFFTIWARKEALLKARDEGLAGNLEKVEFPLPPQGSDVALEFQELSRANIRWSMVDLDAGPGYVATLVAEGPAFDVIMRRHERAESAPAAEFNRKRPAATASGPECSGRK
jgi:4'-phosphopantetheinyl transferase